MPDEKTAQPDFVVRPIHGMLRSKARIDNADGACLARVLEHIGVRHHTLTLVPTDDAGKPDRDDPLLHIRTQDSKRYELLGPDERPIGIVERTSTLTAGGQLLVRTGPEPEITTIREVAPLKAALQAVAAAVAPVPPIAGKREFEAVANHRIALLIRRTGISGVRVEVFLDVPDPRLDELTLLGTACILREIVD